jgi:tail fiber protein gp53
MSNPPIIVLANNASTTLASPITALQTTANLAAGTGSLFPSPSGGQYFPLTFVDAATLSIREIVHVTARATDTITMVRGQEGTTPTAYTTGDLAALDVTAGTMSAMSQVAAEQTAAAQSFVATGGYQVLNNGMIFQWGIFHTTTGNGDTVSFPIAFPTGCLGIVVTEGNASGWGSPPTPTVFGTASRTTTQFALYGVRYTNTGTSSYTAGITALWFAWGN